MTRICKPTSGPSLHSIEFCRHASYQTGRDTTSTLSRLFGSSQTCIAGLCAPVVTHSIWSAIDFGEQMSRYIHIHGLCYVYNMYMSVIYHVYVCNILYIYMDLPNPALCRIVWQLSLLIYSTLESVTTNMTSDLYELTRTKLGNSL